MRSQGRKPKGPTINMIAQNMPEDWKRAIKQILNKKNSKYSGKDKSFTHNGRTYTKQ